MKLLYTIIFSVFATTCFAHGGWKPCVTPVHPAVPYAYPEVVVPAQPVQTLTTFPVPRVYYQWTPYYTLQPVRPNYFVLFPRLHTRYVPAVSWERQVYYSY